MADETSFTLTLPTDLHDDFVNEAAAFDRPAEQIVRELMEQFVAERRTVAEEYDAWFRAEVEQALREADDPTVELIPHEKVMEEWHRERDQLMARLGDKD